MDLAAFKQHREDRAAEVVARVCGAAARRRDVRGGPQGLRDFDLVYLDGRVEPLEVTIAADEAYVVTENRIRRDASRPQATELTARWLVRAPDVESGPDGFPAATDIRRLRRRVVPLLAALESEGSFMFDTQSGWWGSSPRAVAIRALAALGIHGGSARPDHVGSVTFYVSRGTGDGLNLAAVVAREAGKADNRRKLAAVASVRRHLVIDVSMSTGHPWVEAHYGRPSRLDGKLPTEVTTVWVHAMNVWRVVEPPGEWRLVNVAEGLQQPLRI
ncbi:MAG: hypothetical protein AB7L91_15400 [Dehalococcoidia bacterium]